MQLLGLLRRDVCYSPASTLARNVSSACTRPHALLYRPSALVNTHAGKLLYKGAFEAGGSSWQAPWHASRTLRKSANIAVLDWADRIFALYERDLPYELDTQLRTRGRTDAGVWGEDDVLAAHYRVLMDRGSGKKRLVTFGALEAGLDAVMKVVELDEAGDKVSDVSVAFVLLLHAICTSHCFRPGGWEICLRIHNLAFC